MNGYFKPVLLSWRRFGTGKAPSKTGTVRATVPGRSDSPGFHPARAIALESLPGQGSTVTVKFHSENLAKL